MATQTAIEIATKADGTTADGRLKPLNLKFHQHLIVHKATQGTDDIAGFLEDLVREHKTGKRAETSPSRAHIIGAVCRSGKTYITGGLLSALQQQFNATCARSSLPARPLNVLLLTPKPKETLESWDELIGSHADFDMQLSGPRVVVASKQTFREEDVDEWKKQLAKSMADAHGLSSSSGGFDSGGSSSSSSSSSGMTKKQLSPGERRQRAHDLVFKHGGVDVFVYDEAQEGSDSDLVKSLMKVAGRGRWPLLRLYVTFTYKKTALAFDVPQQHIYTWGLLDIRHAREGKLQQLASGHGVASVEYALQSLGVLKAGQGLAHVSQSAVQERLRRDYDDFPDLKYVHLPLEDILGAGQYERKDGTGFDCKALLALDDDGTGFQNADVVDRTLSFIFGGPGEKSHSRTAFIDDLREAAGLRPGQLITLQVFLPCGDGVAELSAVVEKRINQLYGRQYPVLDLCTLTSSEAKRMQSLVAETVQSARKSAAQGAVVLTGRRAGVGITLQDVDATVMLNNCKTESLYVQQIFRSMSSRSKAGASSDGSSSGGISPATKTGIVADTNITRVLKSLGSSFAAPDSSEDEHLECAVDLLHGGLLQVHGRTFSSRQDAQRFVEEAALTSKEPFNKLKISIRDAVDTAADWVAQGGCSSGGGATASAAPQAAASAAGSGILCGYDTKKGPCKNKVKTAGARCYAHREKAAAAPAVGSSSAASSSSAERAASTAAGTDYGEGSCTSDAEEDAVGDHNPNAGPWRRGYRWTTGKIRSHNYRQHINKTSRHADHILELQLVAAEMAYFNISQADAAQIEEACNSEANIESRGQGVNRTKKTLTQTSMRDGIADGLDGWKNDKIQRDKALELAQLCTAGSVAQQVFQQVAERADVRVVAFELQRNWRHVKGQLGETAWMRNIEVLRAKGRTGYNKKGAPIQPLADPLLRGQQQVLREE